MKKKMILFFILILTIVIIIIIFKPFNRTDLFLETDRGNLKSGIFDHNNIPGDSLVERKDIMIAFPPFSYLLESDIENLINSYDNGDLSLVFRLLPLYYDIYLNYDLGEDENVILVDATEQMLYLVNKSKHPLALLKKYPISTSKNGFGNEIESQKTPLGIHKIREKIGEGVPQATVFEYRINTGRTTEIVKEVKDAEEEKITSRILWLDGLESRNNNSYKRYIYIHGTNEEGLIGNPQSDGCIRMKNLDIIELFSLVEEGSYVNISDGDVKHNYFR